MIEDGHAVYQFGPFVLDTALRVVRRQAEIVALTATELDLLLVLVQNAGKSLSKIELQGLVWGGEIRESSTIPQHIGNLRRKLGRSEEGREFIEARRRHGGYYLTVPVVQEPKPNGPPHNEIESFAPESFRQDAMTGPAMRIRDPRKVTAGTILTLAAATAVMLFAVKSLPSRQEPPPTRLGRILPRATSEGRRPEVVSLSHLPSYLAISPSGDKVFAADGRGRTLSILSTADDSISAVTLPQDAGPLAVSPSGKLYIGSLLDGIMAVDVQTGQLLRDRIETGGPVYDLAITPGGADLSLAMSMNGLKRFSVGSAKLTQVSDRICPENLAIDRQGKRLYVAYQCSGPEGRTGHDSVEIFDVAKEISLGIVSGPPMVGGPISVSPDGKLVLLDGSDACSAPQYDHQGCQSAPSHVFHLLRSSDNTIVHTFEFPPGPWSARFLDSSRFVLLGESISVVDAAKYSVLERWNGSADCRASSLVFAPDGRQAYLGCGQSNAILVLRLESPECSATQPGLAMLYTADGTTEDAIGLTELSRHGNPRFTPGRVGQAFFLDGRSYLSTAWTGHYEFGTHDSALALYVKFASVEGEMVLADWTAESPSRGIRLLKSTANHFAFESWPDGGPLESTTQVSPDIWYHLVVTRSGRELTLFVNGKAESRSAAPPLLDRQLGRPLFLGAQAGLPSLHGWLDEIAFYSRALTAEEIKEMYQLREAGPCKL